MAPEKDEVEESTQSQEYDEDIMAAISEEFEDSILSAQIMSVQER